MGNNADVAMQEASADLSCELLHLADHVKQVLLRVPLDLLADVRATLAGLVRLDPGLG